jgi:coenzyme F420-0:L-glutamate ligase / coenzyme F420-1:gamma-L-glutamate ligase
VASLLPISGLPLVETGDSIADLIADALANNGMSLQEDDILVVAQKVVSKAEGRTVRLDQVTPGRRAEELAAKTLKDPRAVELILRESREVLRVRPGLMVVEDSRGFVCANAGIDRSNIQQHGPGEEVALLPVDPDASARSIRLRVQELCGLEIAVVINDSHGRAWREGTVGVAIGVAGLPAVWDRRGERDLTGYVLQHTVIGVADEIAAAASLLMGPAAEGVPAVIVRGLGIPRGNGTARDIQRPRELDLFR